MSTYWYLITILLWFVFHCHWHDWSQHSTFTSELSIMAVYANRPMPDPVSINTTMPVVSCPVPDCGYATDDLDSAIVAALLTAHSTIHLNNSGQNTTSMTREVNKTGIPPPTRALADPTSSTSKGGIPPPTRALADPTCSASKRGIPPPTRALADPTSSASKGGIPPPTRALADPTSSASKGGIPPPTRALADPTSSASKGGIPPPTRALADPTCSASKEGVPTEVHPPAVTQSIRSTTLVVLEEWPIPFVLPKEKFRPNLILALSQKKQTLGNIEKSALIDALYDEVTRYTFVPSKSQYQEVISTLLRNYPHLANGLMGRDAVDLWKKALSNRFRNTRKRLERNNPLANKFILKKKIKDTDPLESVKTKYTKSQNAKYGIPNYLPERPEGETDQTIRLHIKALQNENSKKRPDFQKISALMDLTFADRRKGIVEDNWSVSTVWEEYPCLCDDEILSEFERLMGWSIVERMKQGLLKYASAIVSLVQKANKGNMVQAVTAAVGLTETGNDKQGILSCGALLLIPDMFGEKLDLIVGPKSKKINSPVFISHNGNDNQSLLNLQDEKITYDIEADGELIGTTEEGLLMAICLHFATHYVFNMVYATKICNTMTFLQKLLLDIHDDNTSTPAKVVKALYNINSCLSE